MDNWLMGSSSMSLAPTVFAAIGVRKRKVMVAEAMNGNAWVRHINGPWTMQILLEISHLCDLLDGVQLST